ncbi:MAG: sulfatase-like hydrolase/transferase [Gallionella sp.]|nr:sulfatase-like hydrolase/transferase [Gallionella sp.]
MIKRLSPWLSHPYLRIVILLAIFILPASVMRLALYLIYPDDFGGLSLGQVLVAFIAGLRFDVSMAALLIGVPLLLMLLPFRWSHHRYWQNLWGGFIFVAWLCFIVLMVIDTIYFGQVHRHIGSEINTLSNDVDSMIGIAFAQYRTALLLFAIAASLGGWFWWRLLKLVPAHPETPWLRLLMLPLIFFVLLLAERGGYSGKPMGVGEAFFSDSLEQGYLTMNGAFAMSRALVEKQPPVKSFMPQQQAVAMTQAQLSSPGIRFANADYPLFRTSTGSAKKKPNVVVLMLESWGALHIDAVRREMKFPPLGATPNFDRLAQQGRLYTRFYANGQRSIQGAAAILASQPTLPSMPLLGLGMEQNRLSFLGELAHQQNYQTIFLQSSDHSSFHFDAIAARAGFKEYRGAEDIPNLHEHPKQASTWGTWDHNTFQEANKLFAQANKPFLGFVFTSTTHTPWIVPDARWNKYTGGTDRDAFLNTLLYADWALGQMIDAAKRDGYFDDTIFVITADHANEFVEQPEHVPNQFHIPLLIVGPGVKAGIDQRVGSQVDIVPTLIDLCGWSTPYAGLGRSLTDDTRMEDRAAFTVRGDVMDWITQDGWVSHNLDKRIGSSPALSAERASQLEQRLLSTYQTTIQLQLGNHFVPSEAEGRSKQ